MPELPRPQGARPDPISEFNALLTSIIGLLVEQRMQERGLFPQPDDEDNYVGDTTSVAANATTTVTYTLKKDYTYYFKKIYADAIVSSTYNWKFSDVVGRVYTGQKSLDGNEHEFDLVVKAKGESTLVLTITNTGSAGSVDIVIRSWARRNAPVR